MDLVLNLDFIIYSVYYLETNIYFLSFIVFIDKVRIICKISNMQDCCKDEMRSYESSA